MKSALGMYSQENEYVEFDNECDCSGQVNTNRSQCSVCVCVRWRSFPNTVVCMWVPLEFQHALLCSSGQVESWLSRVLVRMVETLREKFGEAVQTYEEKPREQWLFDYPAQVLDSVKSLQTSTLMALTDK